MADTSPKLIPTTLQPSLPGLSVSLGVMHVVLSRIINIVDWPTYKRDCRWIAAVRTAVGLMGRLLVGHAPLIIYPRMCVLTRSSRGLQTMLWPIMEARSKIQVSPIPTSNLSSNSKQKTLQSLPQPQIQMCILRRLPVRCRRAKGFTQTQLGVS